MSYPILLSGFSVIVVAVVYFSGWMLIRFLVQRGVVDASEFRSSNRQPTPRGGGLVMAIATLGCVLLMQVAAPVWEWPHLLIYVIGGGFIALIGWLDDLRSLSSEYRLLVQILVTVMTLVGFGGWSAMHLPFIGAVPLGFLSFPIGILWIVGLTNAYNFMDGIDSLAGGQAVVGALFWVIVAWLLGLPMLANLAALLAAGSLGFLLHNLPPARMFMGDVGSTFLGYTFAVLPLMTLQQSGNPKVMLLAICILAPFLFDTSFTLLRRIRHGENILRPHRTHLYQRLVTQGWSHGRVSILYLVLGALTAITGIAYLLAESDALQLLALIACVGLVLALWLGTVSVEQSAVTKDPRVVSSE